MSKQKILFVIQILFYIAVIGFIAVRFKSLVSSIDFATVLQNPFLIVMSAVCFLGFYTLLAIHWKRICDKYSKYPQQQQWLAFFASQPFKYLPSSIFAFSSRAVYAKKLGLPIKQSTLVQLLENMNIMLSCLSVAAIFLAFKLSMAFGLCLSALFLLVLAASVFIPEVKIPKSALQISGKEWLKLFVFPFFAWLLGGTGFYFMVQATGQDISITTAIAANAIAIGLGILAVFAPGGIGVREFIYAKFSIASSGIILWRLLTLVCDVVLGVTAIYIINRRLRSTDQTESE